MDSVRMSCLKQNKKKNADILGVRRIQSTNYWVMLIKKRIIKSLMKYVVFSMKVVCALKKCNFYNIPVKGSARSVCSQIQTCYQLLKNICLRNWEKRSSGHNLRYDRKLFIITICQLFSSLHYITWDENNTKYRQGAKEWQWKERR